MSELLPYFAMSAGYLTISALSIGRGYLFYSVFKSMPRNAVQSRQISDLLKEKGENHTRVVAFMTAAFFAIFVALGHMAFFYCWAFNGQS